jgi:hypothetical protein
VPDEQQCAEQKVGSGFVMVPAIVGPPVNYSGRPGEQKRRVARDALRIADVLRRALLGGDRGGIREVNSGVEGEETA